MRVLSAALVVGSAVLIAACGSSSGGAAKPATSPKPAAASADAIPPQVTPEQVAKGKQLFQAGICIQCHGNTGEGAQGGPPLNDHNWIHGNGSYSQIANIIISGFQLSDVIGGFPRGMPERGFRQIRNQPATRLTDAEVAAVAAYVWSISHDNKGAQ
ncbi:MAG TPA: c-type cytochrome [Gemmatimonadaceae bacterium]|nr:c-type cytochrome [Gemmatimonadaceae bacterium]